MKMHFFVSKYCEKTHSKHWRRAGDTNAKANDTVWEDCWGAGGKDRCFVQVSVCGVCQILFQLGKQEELLFVSH